ncbi:dolichyl-phosphate-mannose-protein mannosyltransferase NDAI_0J02980 [Naumovozyma dairenensis CBS 421]|uniref:Dolichyl-phosphate-mannose--protein mannosyltransferase n=1 Tax=Naumovozyma dairenensis (strain ATCC 10597 / BCRC 20456 / CBS 421 / NBRC 0211 / NRRL Y-12639) TaxID=1071378 RepID=G0WHB2_NAUDC|nr:hypothetical protein NDAI_0J02980 [Naumovozyma dairenensis CBS 421]CCD27190.1 hypothetical protein NDAI_0J02980 [Naumovozyma dairenensis CBS 421]
MAASKRHSVKSVSPRIDVDDQLFKYTKSNGSKSFEQIAQNWLLKPLPDSQVKYSFWLYAVTLIACVARFYMIWYPNEVVFDEVHFGKFASYYLERTYFFDVHPPFAKMAIAFIGWLVGYDGSYKFDDIGDSYETHPAPYIAYRSFNAILGTLTVPILFNTLKELNFKAITCAFGALLVAVDNAHVTETRLILLDAILLISIASSFYCFVRFYKSQLTSPFSLQWYTWLYATGISLSFVISTKYIGVMTYSAIGIGIIANLWQLLDIRAGLSLKLFTRHFSRRLNGLILIPFCIYLFWFWVHFTVLNKSGPGDVFMSAEFQDTLGDSPLSIGSKQVNFYDIITIKHTDTNAFLHSHLAYYPLRYEDGRVSSEGQQITGYMHEDINNEWEVLPVKELPSTKGQPVLLNDKIRLRHVSSNTFLLAHDVASPLYPTNEEITTVSEEDANGPAYKETIFAFQPLKKTDEGYEIRTKNTQFRIFHVETAVALWTHNDELLPEWGFEQQEVNGSKDVVNPENHWAIEAITNLDDERKVYTPKVTKSMSFWSKWFELQNSMFEHNNKLSAEHPFASQPQSWPGGLCGVSFWTSDSQRKQIFFTANIVGWWIQVISMAVFAGIILADLATRQRGYFALGKITREKLYGPLLFLFLGWACHYFPFFLMHRQKFLHHYLPAHMIISLFTAGLWEVIFSDCKSLDPSIDEEEAGAKYNECPKIYTPLLAIFFIVSSVAIVWFFIYFAPLIYGNVSLPPTEVVKRQWFDIKLNFAK